MQSTRNITWTLYGIPNCDTVKKARTWLSEHGVDFVFHDFKKLGIQEQTLQAWLQHATLESLVNRKGTSYRALSEDEKQSTLQRDQAVALLIEKPSLIKRPVLVGTKQGEIQQFQQGFKPELYQSIFD